MADSKIGIELWNIEKLVPYEKNAKKHSEDQVAKLARLITKFGWTQPIIVDSEGVIIAGHGRRLAALSLGMKKVPVVCRSDLSKIEADVLRMADNRAASTEYDAMLVQEELARLVSEGWDDMALTAYDDNELSTLIADMGDINMDVLIDDVNAAVDEQRLENERKTEEMDASAAPIVDAFGFKRVTIEQSRRIRQFMGHIESTTGLTGPDALMAHIEAQL